MRRDQRADQGDDGQRERRLASALVRVADEGTDEQLIDGLMLAFLVSGYPPLTEGEASR